MGARPVPAPLQPDHNRVVGGQYKGVLFADYVPPLLCVWSDSIFFAICVNTHQKR